MRPLFFICLVLFLAKCKSRVQNPEVVILISANAEWKVVREIFSEANYENTPWGEYFTQNALVSNQNKSVLFFHEGWGKVAAAGATQYAIDRWNPSILINLGTCGGFEGSVNKYEILLIDQTIIYDIKEAMGNSQEAIRDYSTRIDLNWINFPDSIQKTVLVSADRDLVPEEMEGLQQKYSAIAGDWESGAIAYTCQRNNKRVLILRGVSDLINTKSGEAYSDSSVFISGTEVVMKKLITDLPLWLAAIDKGQLSQSK